MKEAASDAASPCLVSETGDLSAMPHENPPDPSKPGPHSDHHRDIEYLKGMAAAPMGWPAIPPNQRTIDPADLEDMLDRPPVRDSSLKPWYNRPQTYVASLMFAALIVVVLWLV